LHINGKEAMIESDNHGKIIEIGDQGHRSAVLMVQKLDALGANPQQMRDAITQLTDRAEAEAKLRLARRMGVASLFKQHFLNFLPLPHGHGSFLPTL
jgi:hypothetical protein